MSERKFSKRQDEVLDRMKKTIERFRAQLSGDLPSAHSLRSNVYAFDGPRGAGKSVMIHALRSQLMEPTGDGVRNLYVTSPLDCSALPLAADVTPGMAALVHLSRELSNVRRRYDNGPSSIEQHRTILGASAKGSAGFASLALDLSTDPSDYGELLAGGIYERLTLRSAIGTWLDKLAKEHCVHGFVLLLDDFDLVDARQVRAWLRSFMDELWQPQLAIVLTSDFDRLDYLAYDYGAQIDDKTGRAFIQKAIPIQNRQRLGAFSLNERREFTGGLHARRGGGQPRTLEEILFELCANEELSLARSMLLPRLPRGLFDRYEIARHAPERPWSPKTFLATLAAARSEPLLSRRLLSVTHLYKWVSLLPLATPDKPSDAGSMEERWARVVMAVESRRKADKFAIPDIPELVATPASSQAIDSDEKNLRKLGERTLDQHPDWHDPLRHPELRYAPLRDAAPDDQALWAEVIADAAFSEDVSANWRFAKRWMLLRAQLEASCVGIVIVDGVMAHADACSAINRYPILWRWFEEQREAPKSVAQATSEAEDEEAGRAHSGLTLRIGFWPLLKVLADERDSDDYPYDLFQRFLVRVPKNVHSLARRGEAEPERFSQFDVLPRRLAAMILLADGLRRAPWLDLAENILSLDLRLFVLVSAALTRLAYLYASWKDGTVAVTGTDRQVDVLSAALTEFDRRTAVNLLQRYDDELLLWAHDIMTVKVEVRRPEHIDALNQARIAFEARPEFEKAFTLADELIDEEIF